MQPEKLRQTWEEFCKKNEFKLNPDKKHVDMIIDGVLKNEKKSGLKLCPCRIRDGSRQRDIDLICPCNFEIQDTWKEKGMCWCGLFVKRQNYK